MVAQTETEIVEGIGADYAAKYGFSNPDEAGDYFFKSGRGISHEVVEAIAEHKDEPAWMRKVRHRALDYFFTPQPAAWRDLPASTSTTSTLHQADRESGESWEDLPADIGHLGQARHSRGGEEVPRRRRRPVRVEVVYHKLQQQLTDQGCSSSTWTRACANTRRSSSSTSARSSLERQQVRCPEHRRVVGRLVHLCRRASRSSSAPGLLRINAENMGQFERTMIIVDEGAYVHCVEGCTAPIYSSDSLHSAVVEIVVRRRPLPLDDPELVEQRLQPGHEARRRLRGCDDGVGRRNLGRS